MKRFYNEKEGQQLLLYFFQDNPRYKKVSNSFNNNQTQARLLTKQSKVLQVPTPR